MAGKKLLSWQEVLVWVDRRGVGQFVSWVGRLSFNLTCMNPDPGGVQVNQPVDALQSDPVPGSSRPHGEENNDSRVELHPHLGSQFDFFQLLQEEHPLLGLL